MMDHKKSVKKQLTQSDIDIHVKAFLKKGGKVIAIPRGKHGFKKSPVK